MKYLILLSLLAISCCAPPTANPEPSNDLQTVVDRMTHAWLAPRLVGEIGDYSDLEQWASDKNLPLSVLIDNIRTSSFYNGEDLYPLIIKALDKW
jgi:hypothetical protein